MRAKELYGDKIISIRNDKDLVKNEVEDEEPEEEPFSEANIEWKQYEKSLGDFSDEE